ncbi:MAG TPA: hypothetical protein VFX91_01005 [Alcanivorax sp.]|nr:hypothetical protein [Alcanivorax sp.]
MSQTIVITGANRGIGYDMARLWKARGNQVIAVYRSSAVNKGGEDLHDLGVRVIEGIDVNTLGPLRVTHALLDNLHDGSKVGLMTSRMGSIADNDSGKKYGYRISKAGLNAAGTFWHSDGSELPW